MSTVANRTKFSHFKSRDNTSNNKASGQELYFNFFYNIFSNNHPRDSLNFLRIASILYHQRFVAQSVENWVIALASSTIDLLRSHWIM